MFDNIYLTWNQKRIKCIIDHFGHQFMFGKTLLDLGCGHADIGGAMYRLGADVTAVDSRQEHLTTASKKFPGIKTVKADLDRGWPFQGRRFDVALDLALLCHLRDYEAHLIDACSACNHLILETAVCDSNDPTKCILVKESKLIYDNSANGVSARPSAAAVEQVLTSCGFSFKRMDTAKLNAQSFVYDWQPKNDDGTDINHRRLWFAEKINPPASGTNMSRNPHSPYEGGSAANANHPHSPYEIKNSNQSAHRPLQAAIPRPPVPYTPPMPQLPPEQNITLSNTLNPKIRLFYNYYEDKNSDRKKEIDFCFQKNINSPYFDLINIESETNPTFDLFFEKINQLAGPDDISIICNADIFFDQTITLANNMPHNTLYALSRWDWHSENSASHHAIKNSQDTWIIRGKVQNVKGNFQIGKYCCDNRIALEFKKAGYTVINPSKSIKTYHVHNSNVRSYAIHENISEPGLFVDVTNLSNIPNLIPIFAITSMSPRSKDFKIQRESVKSWIKAGCEVVSFQSAEEIKQFNIDEWQGVRFIETSPSKNFKSYIPISSMTKWASKQEGCALLINADCNLCVNSNIMQALANIAKNELVYFVRHDIDANGVAVKQSSGIDAFMFSTKYAPLVPDSDILCIGKPWWDTVLPVAILHKGKLSAASPSFPILMHVAHPLRWSLDIDLNTCKGEAVRILEWNTHNPSNKFLYGCMSGGEIHLKICQSTRNIEYDQAWNKQY